MPGGKNVIVSSCFRYGDIPHGQEGQTQQKKTDEPTGLRGFI